MPKYIEKESAVNYPVMPKEYRKYPTMNLDDAYEQGWFDLEDLLEKLPTVDVEPRWFPVTERLPEEDKEVLISYRYKEGEGDTSHVYISITTYGTMYQGITRIKGWRPPFEYFHLNYEVIAWMPLPTPYKGGEEE